MSRLIDITTPLDKDVLLVRTMRGTEEISRLFEYELTLLSLDGEVNFDELLGKAVTLTLEKADETVRYFHGLVNRMSQGAKQGRFHTYYATVRPWLWFLTRTKNYRIFQEKTVPEVLKEIFALHPIADVKFELIESYTPWTYCVQYDESDFNFVSRLMEHEGIYYYFTHDEGRHTLVIADSYSAHGKAYQEDISFLPAEQNVRPEQEHVSSWSMARELRSGKYALSSYDFEKPSVDLQVKSTIPREHALADYEVFEYGGDYIERGDGETYVRARIEEEQAKFERVQGATNARALAPGFLFTLGLHPRGDQNAEYLVVSAAYDIKSGEHEARDEEGSSYSCSFTALNSKYPFRAERVTEKPIVKGPQTALVVGPSGEEIYTDKFGRVKVHFYWDRYSKRDDKSSCWIRVSQNWGGKGWGGMFIPHVGQEVIVMFDGGDPDLPLITGRVYNAENMPPVALPGGKTKSIIRDYGGNEIVMEGVGGSQQIKLFSPYGGTKMTMGAPSSPDGFGFFTEKDWKAEVKNNQWVLIVGSQETTVNGPVKHVYLAFQHDNTIGARSRFIGGLKNEIVMGVETKVNAGNKTELIAGSQIKVQRGTLLELKGSPRTEKVPRLVKMVGYALSKLAQVKNTVQAGVYSKIGAMQMTKAAKISDKATDVVIDSSTGKFLCKDMAMKASKWAVKASQASVRASSYKVLAKMEVKNGALVVK